MGAAHGAGYGAAPGGDDDEQARVKALAAAGIEASVGSRGDAHDNALAESVIGLFKTEVIRHAGPWRSLDDVEYATLEWVAWSNTCRLLEPLGYRPPAEYEMQFEQLSAAPLLLEHILKLPESPDNPGRCSAAERSYSPHNDPPRKPELPSHVAE